MIRSILNNFSARLAVAVLNFVMLLLFTHYLGKAVYGQISIIALYLTIIHIISDLAGGPSLVYLTPRAKFSSLLIAGTTWSIFNAIGLGSLLIYLGVYPALFGKELLAIGLLVSLHSVNQNMLLGQQRIKAFNLLFLLQGILQIISVCFFLFATHKADPYTFIYASMISNGICYLAGLFLVCQKTPAQKIKETRPILLVLFSNGFYTQAASIFIILCKTICINNLEKLPEGNGAVGIFSSAFSLAGAILLFGASVSSVVMAKVANHENHTETRTIVFKLAKLSLLLTSFAVGLFLLLPAGFYTWLLGKDFSPVKSVFIPMAPGIIFLSLGTVFSHYFSGAGKHVMNFISGGITLLITWIVTHFLIVNYGIMGAGISTSVTYIVMSVFIMGAFIFVGKNPAADLKLLLPAKGDLTALKNIFKKES
ncbi:MAG: polysaccharide biosynthesis C-terminal domain-containing protein [Bacteroidota bacterium]|nr:polysaccharide biosynthesis C-terminal domain-containing protein [Bacteroidota bacterium]